MCAQNHRWGLGPIQTSRSGLKVAVLHEMRARTHIDLSFWCKSRWFDAQNDRLHLGLRYFLFQSKIRCFVCKNYRWGLGPIETSNSDAKHAVMCAQTHRWGLGPIQTCKSGLKVAVLHEMRAGTLINLSFWCKSLWFDAQNDRLHLGLRYFLFQSKIRCFACKNHRWGLGPIETSNSDAKRAVVHAKNDRSCLGTIEAS